MAAINVKSDVAGTVFKLECEIGQTVEAEATIMLLESMKMEIPVSAPHAGKVTELLVAEGDEVAEEQIVAVLQEQTR